MLYSGAANLFRNTAGKRYRPAVVEILCFAVFNGELCTGSLTTVVLHTLHNFQTAGSEHILVTEQANPIIYRETRIIIGRKPLRFGHRSAFLRIVAANVKAHIKCQRLQLRIRIAGVCKLAS